MTNDNQTVMNWLESRKELGRQIDPATAKVNWWYVQILDPYGVWGELPEECQCIGRDYFAAAPGSNEWVWFGDLPEATEEALWNKHKSKLAFPAGLPHYPGRRKSDLMTCPKQASTALWHPGRVDPPLLRNPPQWTDSDERQTAFR